MNYRFVTVVWGEEYTGVFLDVCLPNQLAPGELASFADLEMCEYQVYTTTADSARIAADPRFAAIQEIMPTRIIHLNKSLEGNEYMDSIALMNHGHIMSIRKAAGTDTAFVFLPPDQVYSAGTFRRIREVAQSGKRILLTAGVRVEKESFIPAFVRTFADGSGNCPAPSRKLVGLALDHLHPVILSYFVDSREYNDGPCHFYWRVDDTGFVARALSMHPLMVRPRREDAIPVRSVDGDYLRRVSSDIHDYHIVTDSDELVAFEMSSGAWSAGINGPNSFNIYRCALHLKHGGDHMHRKFLRKKVRIHSSGYNGPWEEVEAESDRVIETARSILAVSYKAPMHRSLFDYYTSRWRAFLDHVKDVVIFGTGAGGEVTLELAECCGWNVSRFIDNNPAKQGTTFHGYPVTGPETLGSRDYQLVIVASLPGKRAIFQQLKQAGLVHRKDFIYYLDTVTIGKLQITLTI